MRRLVGFIYDRRDWFSLLLSLTVSLLLLSNNDSAEIQILRGKANSILSVLYTPVNWVEGIGTLREENQALSEKALQLSLLNSELLHYKIENERLREMLFYGEQSGLNLVPARVLSTGISPLMTTVNISAGSNHGIRPNLAVVSVDGVAGKTISVGPSTAIVQLMTDYNFRLSVKLENSGTVGILRWKEGNVFEVWEIPKATEIEVGEQIITSGYSDIFPPNLAVGEVTGIIDRAGMLHKIAVARAHTDFTTLGHLFVVKRQEP